MRDPAGQKIAMIRACASRVDWSRVPRVLEGFDQGELAALDETLAGGNAAVKAELARRGDAPPAPADTRARLAEIPRPPARATTRSSSSESSSADSAIASPRLPKKGGR